MPADGDDVRACLCNARGNDANARARYELHADARSRIHGAQIVNQLREIFDAVNVVMRRGRNQRSPGGGMPDARNVLADLPRRQLAALTRLRALRHLDFELFGVYEVIGSDSKPSGGDLFDFVRGSRLEAKLVGIFTAFARITPATELIHRQRQRAMCLRAERAKGHRLRAKALNDGLQRLDFIQRHWHVGHCIEQFAEENRSLSSASSSNAEYFFASGARTCA